MAFPVTLNGRTYTLADFSGTNYVEGFPDALEDFVTQAGNIYATTSTSSVAIGSGSKTFTVADSGKPYTVGTPLRIADAAAPATNWIDGIVTSYSGTTLIVNAVAYAGSGTISSWNINIGGGPIAYTGTLPVAQGGTGATTAADARTNLDTYSKSEADSRFLNVSGEASDVTMTGNVTIGDAAGDTLTVNATATMADATLTTADINGGTINGTVIGGSSPAAISGTTGTFSGNFSVDGGTIKLDGNYPVGNDNVALGNTSLDTLASGAYNTAIGSLALTSNASSNSNTAVGGWALRDNTGSANTAVGAFSSYQNTTGGNNTALGASSIASNTTGSANTAVGTEALTSNTTASSNTAVGYQAGYANTTGYENVFVGYQTGDANTTGYSNVATGAYAFGANTSGIRNAAFGDAALLTNTTGGYNVAVGKDALRLNTTASNNTAVGYQAGYSNTTGADMVALGIGALQANTTASNNTAVGGYSLYNNTTGGGNTAFGRAALENNTTATDNTAVGYLAGYYITTGSKNTIIGKYNGNQGGLDIRTSSNNIVLSDGDGNPRAYYDPSASRWNMGPTINRTWVATASIGDNASVGNNVSILFSGGILPGDGNANPLDNSLNVGSASFRWGTVFAATGTINTSDADAKQDIEDLSDAERRVAARIKTLIKKYRFKDAVSEKGDAARIHVGVIAQDVQSAFIDEGLDAARYGLFCLDTWYEVNGQGLDENKRAYTHDTPNAVEKTRLGIRYDELLAFVIAAL